MVHMYIVTNTTIFLVVRLLLLRYNYMFRSSMLAIFRLYMRNLSISYTNMCGEFTVCGVGGARSRFVLEKRGCGLGLFWGCVKIPFMSTYSCVCKWVTFLICPMYIGKTTYIICGLSVRCYCIVYTVYTDLATPHPTNCKLPTHVGIAY